MVKDEVYWDAYDKIQMLVDKGYINEDEKEAKVLEYLEKVKHINKDKE